MSTTTRRPNAPGPRPRPQPTPVTRPQPTPVAAPVSVDPSPTPARIDPRIKRRRIEVTRESGRRRLRMLGLSALVVLVAVGAVASTRSPLLNVDHVQVVGATHTPVEAVVAAGRLSDGPQMLDVNTSSVARRVGRLPWVASAKASRQWPATVRIVVTERKEAAGIPADNGRWAVADAGGHVLAVTDLRPDAMPSVAGVAPAGAPGTRLGPRGRAAVRVAAALPDELRSKTVELAYADDGGLDLRLLEGATVRMGDASQLAEKLDAAVTVLRTVDLKAVRVLDVRVPRAPVVTRK
ncbi:MAG: cell division protein FtsQ [Acidimicrobiaceae bacterium]|nr:cell division protein FtsQ [Acidimicrobiaceae bacterium]